MGKRSFALFLSLALLLGLTAPAGAYDMGYAGTTQVISCGETNNVFIKEDGTLWGMGDTGYDVLGETAGNLSTLLGIFQTTPIQLMDQVTSVSMKGHHIAVIRTDGSLWAWGDSYYGQVGNGVMANLDLYDFMPIVSSPVKIMDQVSVVSCAEEYTAAVKTDGSLWTWGNGTYGQLGNGGYGDGVGLDAIQARPVKILDGVRTVSCGYSHAAAIKTDGSLWMWGYASNGELGNGGTGNTVHPSSDDYRTYYCQTVPVKIMDGVAAVSCGGSYTAAIKTDGSLWMWGDNHLGQLGDGTLEDKTYPVKIMDNVRAVNCGTGSTIVIKTDNSLWAWGWGSEALGEDGVGNAEVTMDGSTFPTQTTPVKVMDNVAAVNSGLAVQMDGSLWTWGSDMYGQMGRGITDEKEWNRAPKSFSTPIKILDGGVALPEGVEPPVPTVGGFSDVPETAYFAQPVLWAVEQGVTSGTSATTFSPDATCSTAEALTFLWRANGSPTPASSDAVPAGTWYADAAGWALEQGLTDGFTADSPATRAAMVTYLWKLAGSPDAAHAAFSDVPAGADYAQAVAWAVAQGVTSGTGDNAFSPDGVCTRAQIVTFLYRALAA